MFIATVVASVLLAIVMIVVGSAKLVGVGPSVATRDRLAVPPTLWRAIGGCELAAAAGLVVGLWVPVVGVAAALGVALLMIGAIGSHYRVSDPVARVLPAVGTAVLAVVVLFFRQASRP